MSVKVKCTSCEAAFAVHERVLGTTVACPRCDFKLTLPSADELNAFKQAQLEKAKQAERQRKKQAKLALAAKQQSEQVEAEPAFKKTVVRRRRKRERGHGGEHDEAWDITPMVDVVFLLLIFFMLTASFSIQKVIRTGRQQSDKPSRMLWPIKIQRTQDQ